MDPYGVEQQHPPEVVDSQLEPGDASITQVSHSSTYESAGKIINNKDINDSLSRQKDSQVDRTSKANAPTLPTAQAPSPVPSGDSRPPAQPTVQRSISAAANFHRNRQTLPASNSTTSFRHAHQGEDLPSAENPPSISVVSSSPPIYPSASRATDPTETVTSVAESPARIAREAANERRANRRRSGVDGTNNHRLSGFFSNLLHLRERDEAPPLSSRTTHHSTPARPPSPPSRGNALGPGRPHGEPLPPAMPAPTLDELGLSLSTLTGELPSNQFTTPSNGTFLSPHYLLLCHPQGLDIMPLVSPPAVQPYALIRRVPVKSVVVMEERGVLVAIAGRRDVVRVYALEEIRKAIDWRMDLELRREIEKQRRDEMKKIPIVTVNPVPEKTKNTKRKSVSIDSLTASQVTARNSLRKRSKSNAPAPPLPPVAPMPPPSFPQRLVPRTSVANLHIHRQANSRARAMSITEAMGAHVVNPEDNIDTRPEGKGEWVDIRDSDEEALIAAGPSGSAALDERTSAISAARASTAAGLPVPATQANTSFSNAGSQRRRPANLDLSHVNEHDQRPQMASPSPTLMTIRQTLNQCPQTTDAMASDPDMDNEPATPNGEVISFAEALLESRLPEAPPLGQTAANPAPAALVTRFPLSARSPSSHGYGGQGISHSNSPLLQEAQATRGVAGLVEGELSDHDNGMEVDPTVRAPSRSGGSVRATNRRHRWSVLDGVFRPSETSREPIQAGRDVLEDEIPQTGSPLTRTMSDASIQGSRPSRTGHRMAMSQPSDVNSNVSRGSTRLSRFFPVPKRKKGRERNASITTSSNADHLHAPINIIPGGYEKWTGMMSSSLPVTPAPKLEYVKLPGTKGSVMIKAVETAKKSFLAILCGESGEKVELFAGTYRTALSLSRTFILPDSPRTLELQLQGDDLVEVFLVFSQNVFALEPATVRVREVRIGRQERRAARRRANRGIIRQPVEDINNEPPPPPEDDVVITAVVAGSEAGHNDNHLFPNAASRNDSRRPSVQLPQDSPITTAPNSVPPSSTSPHFPSERTSFPQIGPPVTPHPEELATAAMIAMGPYTTFQQLSFAPPFPLATLADECMIPPTYKSVLEYKDTYEKEDEQGGSADDEAAQEASVSHDVQWYYKDPRGIVRGPWASSLMQSWFKDDFLPLDLPVRRENETDYIPLKELQRQSIDPSSPFRPPPPGLAIPLRHSPLRPEGVNPLLEPISILTQEKRLGPPALFYSSRGGHSTSIVDAKGRSVLKGRFYWTPDEASPRSMFSSSRLGDVKRLEAFEVGDDKAVIVAFRQGGLEAAEIGDAIMTPGDGCRTVYPYFDPPTGTYNRRSTFLWRTGQPVSATSNLSPSASSTFPRESSGAGKNVPPTSAALKRRSLNPYLLSNNRGASGKMGPLSDGEEDRDHSFSGQEELLVVARLQDKVYFVDRSSGSFRFMVLSTIAASS